MAAKPLEETLWRAKGFFGARRVLTVRSWLIILPTVFAAVVLAINKTAPVVWFGILFFGMVKAFQLDDWLTRKVAGVWLEQIKPLSVPAQRPSFVKFFTATFLVVAILLGFSYYQLGTKAFLALLVFAVFYVFLPIINAHLQATDFFRKNPCTVSNRIPIKRVLPDGLVEDGDGKLTEIGAINGNLPGGGLTADDPVEIRADAFARLLLAVAVFNQRRGGTVKMYFLTESQTASSSKITDARLSRFQLSVLLAYHPELEENLRESLLDVGLELTRLNQQEAVAFINTFWSGAGFVNHLNDNPGELTKLEQITYDETAGLQDNHYTAILAVMASPARLGDIETVTRSLGGNLCLMVNVRNQRQVEQELKGKGFGVLMLFDRQQRQSLDGLKKALLDPEAKNYMLKVLTLIAVHGKTSKECLQAQSNLLTNLSRKGIGVMPLAKRALEEGFLACLPIVNDAPLGAFDAVSAARALAETNKLNGLKAETLSKPVTEQLASRAHGDWSDLAMLREGPDTIYLGTGIRGSPQRDFHAKPFAELFLMGMLGNQRYGKSTMAAYMVQQVAEKGLLRPVVINPNAGDRTWEQFIRRIDGAVLVSERDVEHFRQQAAKDIAGKKPLLYQARAGSLDPANDPCMLAFLEMLLDCEGMLVVIDEVNTFTAYEEEIARQASRVVFRLIKRAGHNENAICVITQRIDDLIGSPLGDLITGEILAQGTGIFFHLDKIAADSLEQLGVPQVYRQQVERLRRGESLLATRGGGEARSYYVLKLALSRDEREGLRKERVQFHDRPLLH